MWLLWGAAAAAPGVVVQTTGCSGSGWAAGASTAVRFLFNGVNYSHVVQTPVGYDPSVPGALLLYFHKWGGDSASCGSTCDDANSLGFITAAVTSISGNFTGGK